MKKSSHLFQSIGPGILIACAAIGGSHLVWATKAGAEFGWQLLGLVLIANFLKFPFFYFGQHYTAVTGESMLAGYRRLGKQYLYIFLAINALTGTINIAAVGMLTASLCAPYLEVLKLSLPYLSIALFILVALILLLGHYALLDRLSKWIISLLGICTLYAVLLAFGNPIDVDPNFVPTNPFTLASLGFLISLLGWMPAPIDLSTWSSLWMHSRAKQTGHTASPKEVALDFSIGYIATTVLACLFLALGALTLYGSNSPIASGGIQFSNQLIELYTQSIGDYARPLIALAAFFTMFSTTLTCLDGYPRSLSASLSLLKAPTKDTSPCCLTASACALFSTYASLLILYTISASIVLLFFVSNLLELLSFAAIIAFLTAPILAWINLRVVYLPHIPKDQQPALWIKITSYLGLSFFGVVSITYIYTRFFAHF